MMKAVAVAQTLIMIYNFKKSFFSCFLFVCIIICICPVFFFTIVNRLNVNERRIEIIR